MEGGGRLPMERAVQKGYEYQAVCVCVSNWTHAQPANPDPVCVYVCIGSLMSRRRSCGAD